MDTAMDLLRARYPHARTIEMRLNGPTLVDGQPVNDPRYLRSPVRREVDPLLLIASGWSDRSQLVG